MSPPLLPQDITMTETEETVLDLEALKTVLTWLDALNTGGQACYVVQTPLDAPAAYLEQVRFEELQPGDGEALADAINTVAKQADDIADRLAALSRAPEVEDPVYDALWELVSALANEGIPKTPRSKEAFRVGREACLDRLHQDEGRAPPSTGGAIKRTMTINLTDEEMAALEALAKAKDMQPPTIFRHALRIYQVSHDEAVNGPIPRGPLGSPSPEMGEISRETLARIIDPEAWEEYLLEDGRVDQEVASIFQEAYETSLAKADQILKLKENGLSREELGGSARASRGAAGPSDCAEGVPPLSDGGRGQ